MSIPPLPKIMVAPNGARRKKTDHPAIPVTIEETVKVARQCYEAGAIGLHAHVRDAQQDHVLDVGLYRELISEMAIAVPDMLVQITTEAVGRYDASHQRRLVSELNPHAVSVGLLEMLSDGDVVAATDFYHQAHADNIAVQHIVYNAEQLAQLFDCIVRKIIPETGLQLMFVLGRYTKNQQSSPGDLDPYLVQMKTNGLTADWAVCAFGQNETDCLVYAHEKGGHLRVGFENSLWNRDGNIATDNSQRVAEVVAAIG